VSRTGARSDVNARRMLRGNGVTVRSFGFVHGEAGGMDAVGGGVGLTLGGGGRSCGVAGVAVGGGGVSHGAAEKRKLDGRPAFGSPSLTRWASSINQVHTAAGFPAPGRSEVVRQVRQALSGVRRTRKTPPKRRSPLLLVDVRSLLEAMRPSMYVWPAAMAAHRRSELVG